MEAHHGEDRRRAHKEFLTTCTLLVDTEPVRWRAACATALARGELSAAGVRAALAGTSVTTAATPSLPAALAQVHVPAGDLRQYDRLLTTPP
jgi:hypothetical protein